MRFLASVALTRSRAMQATTRRDRETMAVMKEGGERVGREGCGCTSKVVVQKWLHKPGHRGGGRSVKESERG